jgi:alkylation response protein AidB-like acyl-CoA dehydrogenase
MDVNMWGGRQAHLRFVDCRVPRENIMSFGRSAFAREFQMYNVGRLGAAAMSVAAANCALKLAVEYVTERRQFGSRIADFQGIRWQIAEMATDVEAARSLTYRGLLNAAVAGRPASRVESSMAKLFATRMARDVVDGCLQLFGATGFMRGTATEYLYRFIRGNQISGGTSQIQKNIIGDAIVKARFPQLDVLDA